MSAGTGEPLLELRRLEMHFPVRRGVLRRTTGWVQAVDGVDLRLEPARTYGLVGESGSGKTTLGRCAVRLLEPTGGEVRFQGEDLLALSAAELRRRRRFFQMVFQDPYGSLNPRMRVRTILGEPLAVHSLVPRSGRRERVAELLAMVGLPAEAAGRYPHEFSGGQRQRIGIARALATEPELVVADEPVSALDVSVRAQVINLLVDLQRELGLALLFIAHDLALVEQVADRVGVMYLGRLVEEAPTAALFARPLHPYTGCLLSAVPMADPGSRRERIVLPGEPPSPTAPPPGCRFHPRCPIAEERCTWDDPPLVEVEPGRWVACHFPGLLEVGAGAGGGTLPPPPRSLDEGAAAERAPASDAKTSDS